MSTINEARKFKRALIDWDEEILATWADSGLKLKDCGTWGWCDYPAPIKDNLYKRLTREKIDKLFEWKFLSPTENVGILANFLRRSGAHTGTNRESSTHATELFYLMGKFDKGVLASWRRKKSGCTIAHFIYYGLFHCPMYTSLFLHYLIDECKLDPKVEARRYDKEGSKTFLEEEHGETLIELAIYKKDVASIFFLLERGCDPNIYDTKCLEDRNGRDPLMNEVWLFSRTLDAQIREKHRINKYLEHEGKDVAKCVYCRYYLPPKVDDSIRDLYTVVKECIRHGYDLSYKDFSGKSLEDHIADMLTCDRKGNFMIDWYRCLMRSLEEEE